MKERKVKERVLNNDELKRLRQTVSRLIIKAGRKVDEEKLKTADEVTLLENYNKYAEYAQCPVISPSLSLKDFKFPTPSKRTGTRKRKA